MKQRLLQKSAGAAGLLALVMVFGGCASRMSDFHPTIPKGSQGDVALGIDRSAAFDYQVDDQGNVVATSPIHIEKGRGSQVFAESTAGVYYLAGAFAQGATGYRQIDGTWASYQKVSGTVNQNVTGGTYNEHDVYGSVNVNHGGTVNHQVNGYIYNEHEVYGTVNHRVCPPR